MKAAIVITPESKTDALLYPSRKRVFLAGTIDMGNSENWQAEAIKTLADEHICILNPRRVISPENADEINFQINWELDQLEKADFVFMYFLPGSFSPITLLELGFLLGRPCQLVVVCNSSYSRHMNVENTIKKFKDWHPDSNNTKLLDNFSDGIEELKKLLLLSEKHK